MFVPPPPSESSSSAPSPPAPTPSTPRSTYIIIIVIVVVLALAAVGLRFARNTARTASPTRVPPRRVVQASPGARGGPIIAEMGAVIRQEQGSVGPTPAYSSPSTDNRPSQATTNRLSSPHDENRRSRTLLDAGVIQVAGPPPRTIIHRTGPASQDDEDPPDDMPPPYLSMGSP